MGCRTGFYLILGGDCNSKDIVPLIKMFEFINDFEGDIQGNCHSNGNYQDMNLTIAKHYANVI